MKNLLFSNFIISVCILLAISGCTSMPTRRETTGGEVTPAEKPLSVSTNLRFEDVPIPTGFNNLRDQSFLYQNASLRVGFLRYSGRANANQVVTFFKTQMTLYNWELQNIIEHGTTMLNFIKSDESCIIAVEPLATKTIVSIQLSPLKGTLTTGLGSGKTKF